MAQIDLKFATIYIQDGTSKTGAVNNVSNYAANATTMIVDSITGIISNGTQFTIAGETGLPVHTVTAHSETSTNTTSITFTPGLATGGAADNAIITFGPNRIEVNIGEGNLTYTEKREMKYIRNRGRLDAVMLGDEQPVEVSMNFIWETITGSDGDPPTIEDAFKGVGGAVAWVTAGSDPCEPFAVDIVVVYTPPCSDVEMETITLRDFRYEDLEHNFKDAQVSVKGKCNITEATAVRSTNTYTG